MCGISVMVGPSVDRTSLDAMVQAQSHRGPDACGTYVADEVGLGHNRLSIIDLSDLGRQPMTDESGTLHLVFNGEIYNYQSLRQELGSYPFRSESDSEVLLAAFRRWGVGCLDRLEGMFAFAVWDSRSRSLFAARDRFGVKPLYYHMAQDTLTIASELPAFAAAGIPLVPDEHAWSNYLALGVYDTSEKTFWEHILALPPGHSLCWKAGRLTTNCWYDLAERCQQPDCRELSVVREEYEHLLADSMAKRFRADVPVGINLSGGLDSSVLLGLVDQHFGGDNQVQVFSYVCDDSRYDELPWVERMLAGSDHPLIVSPVAAGDVPTLADEVWNQQLEPYGGLPTLAYSRCFADAKRRGVTVLLDGQGMDEQWAGYDYYRKALQGNLQTRETSTVQGTSQRSTRPECLTPAFRKLSEAFVWNEPFPDTLRNLQYRDACYTKIPKAVRFNDRVSMMHSTELREPFLDHRLFELAVRQPVERKIQGQTGKWMLREIASQLVRKGIAEAPKRPLQTPQREWLRDELREWTNDLLEHAIDGFDSSWLDGAAVRREWNAYLKGESDNSFYIWQWASLGMMSKNSRPRAVPFRNSL